ASWKNESVPGGRLMEKGQVEKRLGRPASHSPENLDRALDRFRDRVAIAAAKHENAPRIVGNIRGGHRPRIGFERKHVSTAGLEMQMVRSRCSGLRPVINDEVTRQLPAKIERSADLAVDGLRPMFAMNDRQMAFENRVGICEKDEVVSERNS